MEEIAIDILKQRAAQFAVQGNICELVRYGDGHINDTYLLKTSAEGKMFRYIFQRINTSLFENTERLMNNIALVTEFNRQSVVKQGGDPDREGLTLIKTLDGENFLTDADGNAFRMYLFIADATTYSVVRKPSDFYESAVAFGKFTNLLSSFDASQLYEILPNFHNTVWRYENFEKAVKADKVGRVQSVQKEIDWVRARKHYGSALVEKLNAGEIPLRVTHNDTKLNNVMLDDKTGKAMAVIDLDTVMPGSLCYDFGDSIRFGCNPCAEDEPDLSKVNFSVPLFRAYAEGYLSAVGGSITQIERDNLVMGAMLMTYECGMRFLTDYLQGDTYFRTHRAAQNLDRTRTQFKLVEEMERLRPELEAIIREF